MGMWSPKGLQLLNIYNYMLGLAFIRFNLVNFHYIFYIFAVHFVLQKKTYSNLTNVTICISIYICTNANMHQSCPLIVYI